MYEIYNRRERKKDEKVRDLRIKKYYNVVLRMMIINRERERESE